MTKNVVGNYTQTVRNKGYKPLAELDGKTLFYRKGNIYAEAETGLECVMTVRKRSWKDYNRLFIRLFRYEPKYAVNTGVGLLLVGEKKIILANIADDTCQELVSARQGFSDPLNILPVYGKWVAVWGDYGPNAGHEAVNIYGLDQDKRIEILHIFRPGQVRHVHNIIPKREGGYYIFTGDQEAEAGIYSADEDFQTVIPIAVGKQEYRVVVGFDTPQGLLYATDAVNELNYIFLRNSAGYTQKLFAINGSCIYGRKYRENYLFSTTVEPDESNSGLLSWLSTKRGQGILSDEVCLVCVDRNMEVSTLLRYKKDCWPMKLMQYGSIQFVHGDSEALWIYPIGVREYDGTAIKLENCKSINRS